MFGRNSNIYTDWKETWERYKNFSASVSVVNLGSSASAYDFDYSLWDKEGINFASTPQTLYYDLQVLQQYGKKIRTGGIVFICLSEFCLLVNHYKSDSSNYKYYGYLDPDRILNYNILKSLLVRHLPGVIYPTLIKQEISLYIKQKKIFEKSSNCYKQQETSEKVIVDSWKKEFGWEKEWKLSQEQMNTINTTMKIVFDIISYCDKKEIKPIVIIPPFSSKLHKMIPESFIYMCLGKQVDELKKKKVLVFDFYNDEEMSKDELFENAIVMNSRGRKLFNYRLQEILEKREYEKQ